MGSTATGLIPERGIPERRDEASIAACGQALVELRYLVNGKCVTFVIPWPISHGRPGQQECFASNGSQKWESPTLAAWFR